MTQEHKEHIVLTMKGNTALQTNKGDKKMANIYAHASVEGITVFEETFKPTSGVFRGYILVKARTAVEQFISIRYGLSEEGEEFIFDTLNDDEEMVAMMLGYSESWISEDGLAAIVVELTDDEDGDQLLGI